MQDDGLDKKKKGGWADWLDSLWKGALIGALILGVALPVMRWRQHQAAPAPATIAAATPQDAIRTADFGGHEPSPDARQAADWIVTSRDNTGMSFVVVDKKDARVYVFDAAGHLKESAPALLGAAVGDDSFPGIGDKPLAQVLPQEKTTPSGRYIAELGVNTKGEDIVWVDYDAAVSMHRVRALVKEERRLERLASPTAEDNRISFGCINLPPAFYENVLRPTVQSGRTVIYVLPESRPLQTLLTPHHEAAMVAGAVTQR